MQHLAQTQFQNYNEDFMTFRKLLKSKKREVSIYAHLFSTSLAKKKLMEFCLDSRAVFGCRVKSGKCNCSS